MTAEQSQLFHLLCIFKEKCDQHRLRYYLAGGTLLGAVRHQGFIPWDDDIDVAMPLKDYLAFQKLSVSLPEHIVVQTEENDPQYPFVFLKLCDTRYPFDTGHSSAPKGVYIDVFPLIPSKNPGRETTMRFQLIRLISYVLQVKLDWTDFVPYRSQWKRSVFWLLGHFSVERLRELRRKQIERLYQPDGTETLWSPGGAYKADKEFFPAQWYRETAEMSFEGESFSVPIDWQKYLSRHYGNFMELPPLEKRQPQHKRTFW